MIDKYLLFYYTIPDSTAVCPRGTTEQEEGMEKKIDFRVQRTYTLLTSAMMDLLKEKSFDEITVGELCERAMIRRATFYKHFADKFELFAFAIRELEQAFERENKLIYDVSHPKAFYLAMIDRALQFVEQNAAVFTSVFKSRSSQMLLDILSNEIERDTLLHLKADEANGADLPGRPELLAAVMTGALVYIMRWWVRHDLRMPRSELLEVYASLVRIV